MRRPFTAGMPQAVVDSLVPWSELFPAEDDLAWKDWVDFARREYRDLRAMLESDFRDGFKARALFIMLVPSLGWNPFYWKGDRPSANNYLYLHSDWSDKVPDSLVTFYAQLVAVFCGAIGHHSVMEPGEAYYALNGHLLALLERAPMEVQEGLFPFYQINDPVVFWNMDTASGYNPYAALMRSKADERWKRLADDQFKAVIVAELGGQTRPRAEHEAALPQYLAHVQLMAMDGELPYSRELFASQIEFVVSLGDQTVLNFNSWQVAEIYQLLRGPQYLQLRRKFARFVALKERDEFSSFKVNDYRTFHAAEMMLADCGDDDGLLRTKLSNILAQGREYLVRQDERKRESSQTETSIHDRMR